MSKLKKFFGINLKLLRKSHNLTQEELSELVDVHPQQISKIENGGYFPSSKTLELLCKALNVPPFKLFDFYLDDNDTSLYLTKEKLILEMLDKFKKLADNPDKLQFIDLALDALDNKDSLQKLDFLIKGVKLSQKQ